MSEKTMSDHIKFGSTPPEDEVRKSEFKIIREMHSTPRRLNKPSGSSGSTRSLTKLPNSAKNKICRPEKSNSVEVSRKTNTAAHRTVSNLRTRPKMTQNVTVVPNMETPISRRHSPSPTSDTMCSNEGGIGVIEDQIINGQEEFVETELDVEQPEAAIELEPEANTGIERQEVPTMDRRLSSEVEGLTQGFGSCQFFCEETNNFANECRSKLCIEITNMEEKCQEWNSVLELHRDNIPEDIVSEIEAVIEKATSLIARKLNQFQDLVDRFEQKCSGAPMEDDLRGFWDDIMIELRDIYKEFDSLKENYWMEEKPNQKVVHSKNQLTMYEAESEIKLAIRAVKDENKNKMKTDNNIASFNQIYTPASSNVGDFQGENKAYATPDINGLRRSERIKKALSKQKSRDIFGEVQNRPFDTPRTTQTTSAKKGKSETKESTKKSLAVDLMPSTPTLPRRSMRLQYTPRGSERKNCIVCSPDSDDDI